MSLSSLKALGTVSMMTMLSRISGLFRDILFAQYLGSGQAADVFFVAFRMPNFFRRIFGEGALSTAFIPVYSEFETNYSRQEAKLFLDIMTGRLMAALAIFTALGVILSPNLVRVLAPGFTLDALKFESTVNTLRWTFPYLFFISLVALGGGILNTHKKFGAYAVSPILLNLCLITTVVTMVPSAIDPAVVLGIGVLIAGFIQFAFQFPFLIKIRRLPVPRLGLQKEKRNIQSKKGVRKVVRLMIPSIFGVSIAQINLLINTVLASFLVTGSVSWLYYSDRIMEFPLGVFGIALATVILPILSKQMSKSDVAGFRSTLNWALKLALVVCIPAASALIILAVPIVATLFHYGRFSEHDVYMASQSLAAFSFGLVGFVMVKILAPGFYAKQDTRTPVVVGALAMGVNALVALVLVWNLKHVGLAMATTIAGLFNAVMLLSYLIKSNDVNLDSDIIKFSVKVMIATVLMSLLLIIGPKVDAEWIDFSLGERIYRLSFWIISSTIVYVGSLYIVGLRLHKIVLRSDDAN